MLSRGYEPWTSPDAGRRVLFRSRTLGCEVFRGLGTSAMSVRFASAAPCWLAVRASQRKAYESGVRAPVRSAPQRSLNEALDPEPISPARRILKRIPG